MHQHHILQKNITFYHAIDLTSNKTCHLLLAFIEYWIELQLKGNWEKLSKNISIRMQFVCYHKLS